MLHSFKIESLADIRSYPGSRKLPQFNKEALEISLPQKDIQYIQLKALGGRRKVNPGSKNTSWRNLAIRGYADYMETDTFKEVIKELEKVAMKQRTAFICSEAVSLDKNLIVTEESRIILNFQPTLTQTIIMK